jgi:hypothetical protein
MRARLLHIHVLTGLARPDRLQGVVVVGRGNRDGIDGFIFSSLRKSVNAAGRFFPAFSNSPTRAFSTDSSTSQIAAISTFCIAL